MVVSRNLFSIPGGSTHADTCSMEARRLCLVAALYDVSLLGWGDVCGGRKESIPDSEVSSDSFD
jgi:hypothetical protein